MARGKWQFGFIDGDTFAGWITPAEALARVKAHLKSESLAANAIVEHLADNMVGAAAATGIIAERDSPEERASDVLIPHHHWKQLPGSALTLWQTSRLEIPRDRGETRITYYGIKIDPAAIDHAISQMGAPAAQRPNPWVKRIVVKPEDAISLATPKLAPVPVTVVQPRAVPQTRRQAGRLPKDYWEDMIIAAMTAMFYEATLQPKSGADVRRWMEAWLSKNIEENDHPGDTAIKERAAKVFAAWQESRK